MRREDRVMPDQAASGARDVRGFAPAAAPVGQTGKVAFDRAKESGRLSQANTLTEADAAAEDKLQALGAASNEMQRAGGRVFRRQAGVWTDIGHSDSLRVLSVAPFSPAYFALVRALPELTASLQMEQPVLVAGKRASLKVESGGKEKLTDGELREFVRQFRGLS
jgi:hypothetical protein